MNSIHCIIKKGDLIKADVVHFEKYFMTKDNSAKDDYRYGIVLEIEAKDSIYNRQGHLWKDALILWAGNEMSSISIRKLQIIHVT